MIFMKEWTEDISKMRVAPFLDSLIGTELRFRDNEIDRRKLYLYHSPAHTVSQILSKKNGVFWKTPLYCSVLDEDEWKREGFDRFLTFKIEYGFRGNEKRAVCTYVTLKIEPCEVEPLRKGGITEGSRIVDYITTIPDGGIGLTDLTTVHDLMMVDTDYYYKWLHCQIMDDYKSEVHMAMDTTVDEVKETISRLKHLCNELELDMLAAQKLVNKRRYYEFKCKSKSKASGS